MPYKVEKRGSQYVVIREGEGKGPKIKGRHDTRSKAERQKRALYARTGGK